MAIQKVSNIVISDGTALPTAGASITTIGNSDIGIFTKTMIEITPGNTVSDTGSIYLGQKDSNGNFRKTMEIGAKTVRNYIGRSYVTASKEVWTIGHNRKTTVGTIELANLAEYKFSIHFTGNKSFGSERPLIIRKSFVTDASATQLEVATAITTAINADAFLATQVIAVTIGDGTGVYGLTGATDYGSEITGIDQTQFSTGYVEERVRFDVHVDDSSGFGATTTCTQINAMSFGTGTYQEVYNMENFMFGYEGTVNRTLFPIPVLTYQASNTFYNSAALLETVSGTIAEDTITFSATVAYALQAGDKIVVNATNVEIKYFVSTTVAVLTAVLAATHVATTVKKRMQYDIVNIEFETNSRRSGTGMENAEQIVVIAVPAIDSGGTYNSNSTGGADVLAALNPYFNSVGFANITI